MHSLLVILSSTGRVRHNLRDAASLLASQSTTQPSGTYAGLETDRRNPHGKPANLDIAHSDDDDVHDDVFEDGGESSSDGDFDVSDVGRWSSRGNGRSKARTY